MTMHQLISIVATFFTDHWPGIKDFFNSVFFTSIAGACAGAFAGARSAQIMAERAKVRETMMAEIRNTNAASMMAFSAFNTFTSLWSQHVKRLKEDHDSQKAVLAAALDMQRQGQRQAIEFHYVTDLQTLSLYDLPVDTLQRQIFEKVSTQGRPMALAIVLNQTAQSLKDAIKRRNDLIEIYKNSNFNDAQRLGHIFGLPTGDGQINNDYPSTLDAIYSYTKDGIYFSHKLSTDLTAHGEEVGEVFKKRFKTIPPPVTKADFTPAINAGYVPNPKDYESWDTMFVKSPSSVKKS